MLTCNDCGYDEQDCVCSFTGGTRGPKLWEREKAFPVPEVCSEHGWVGGAVATCDHDYECTYEGMDGERYRCKKCNDSYFLDYDEMR